MHATWSQPVAEVVVFSNDFASRRARPRRPWVSAQVPLRHQGWQEPVEFMHHCSTKWATFLMSLKSLLETGAGAPAPYDVKVSDWH